MKPNGLLTAILISVNWSAPAAWYRGKADATRIDGPVADGIDWKTGRIKEDETQLLLMAQLVFANFPEVKRCRQSLSGLRKIALQNVFTPARYGATMVWDLAARKGDRENERDEELSA